MPKAGDDVAIVLREDFFHRSVGVFHEPLHKLLAGLLELNGFIRAQLVVVQKPSLFSAIFGVAQLPKKWITPPLRRFMGLPEAQPARNGLGAVDPVAPANSWRLAEVRRRCRHA